MAKKSFYPETVTGYELSPMHGWFSVLDPAQMTNLCTNPSFENALTTNYSEYPALTGTIAATTDKQRRGGYSLIMTPSGGAFDEGATYGDLETETDDINHTISFDIWGKGGHTFEAYIMTSAPAIAERMTFKTKGIWERKYLTFFKASGAPTAQTLYIVRTDPLSDTAPFYLDGFLLTEGTEKSTYFDGDSLPYGKDDNYVWLGGVHASQSVRSSAELSSGVIRNLNDYKYNILGFFGLGLDPQNHVIFENALIGGGSYQRGQDQMREFSIVGAIARESLKDLLINRANIQDLLKNAHVLQQPMTIRVELKDDCGVPFAQPVHLRSLYMGGFEGSIDNLYQEKSSLQFTMDHPKVLEDGEEGGALDTVDSIGGEYAVRRMVGTGYDDWDNNVNGLIYDMKYNKDDGKIYVVGSMTQAGSAPTVVYNAARWNVESEAWEKMPLTTNPPSGVSDTVLAVEFAGNGDIFLGGMFQGYNNVAGDDYLVYYEDGVGWTKYVVTLPCVSLSVAPDGDTVYALCATPAGGATSTVYKITHSTNTIANIGTVTNTGNVYLFTSCVARNGDLYIGGIFDDIDGDAINGFAKYDGSTWSQCGQGLSESVGTLSVVSAVAGSDGNIYLFGQFDDAGGVVVENIAMWNGESFTALGGGVGIPSVPQRMTWHKGLLYVPRTAVDLDTTVETSVWNGSNWTQLDNNYDDLQMMVFDALDNIYSAVNNTAFEVSGSVAVVNSGTANADPVIIIKGKMVTPAAHVWDDKLIWIKNETTDQTMYFDLNVHQNETITIDLRRGRKKVISSSRGDVTGFVLPSSVFSDFYIAPGTNYITVFVDNISDYQAELVAYIYWTIPHDYISGALT